MEHEIGYDAGHIPQECWPPLNTRTCRNLEILALDFFLAGLWPKTHLKFKAYHPHNYGRWLNHSEDTLLGDLIHGKLATEFCFYRMREERLNIVKFSNPAYQVETFLYVSKKAGQISKRAHEAGEKWWRRVIKQGLENLRPVPPSLAALWAVILISGYVGRKMSHRNPMKTIFDDSLESVFELLPKIATILIIFTYGMNLFLRVTIPQDILLPFKTLEELSKRVTDGDLRLGFYSPGSFVFNYINKSDITSLKPLQAAIRSRSPVFLNGIAEHERLNWIEKEGDVVMVEANPMEYRDTSCLFTLKGLIPISLSWVGLVFPKNTSRFLINRANIFVHAMMGFWRNKARKKQHRTSDCVYSPPYNPDDALNFQVTLGCLATLMVGLLNSFEAFFIEICYVGTKRFIAKLPVI